MGKKVKSNNKKSRQDSKQKMATGTSVKGYLENPATELAQANINMARAQYESETNPLTQGLDMMGKMVLNYGLSQGGMNTVPGINGQDGEGGLGSAMNSGLGVLANLRMAMGGRVPSVPVEVEGEEMAHTPYDEVLEFKGPSHEQGGMDVDLPENTEVYSKRIEVDGETMAERKKKREKQLAKLQKLMKLDPTSQVSKNSLQRTEETHAAEDERDRSIQRLMKSMSEVANQSVEEFMFGGKIEDLRQKMAGGGPALSLATPKDPYSLDPYAAYAGVAPPVLPATLMDPNQYQRLPGDQTLAYEPLVPLGSTETGSAKELPWYKKLNINLDLPKVGENEALTPGDAIGMAGNLMGLIAPRQNTLRNRAGDTPNENFYEDFGKDALQTLDNSRGYLDEVEAQQLRDLELSRGAATRSNRNSARGVNTMRALDLATQQTSDRARAGIRSNASQQMMQLMGQEASLEATQDQVVMRGEQERDLADRADRDAFYSNMAQNLVGEAEGLQQIGKDLNQVKNRAVIQNLLGELSKYGITVDGKGKLTTKDKEK